MSRTTPFLATITIVSLFALAATWADEPADQQRPTRPMVDPTVIVDPPDLTNLWGLQLSEVPKLLRMHVRALHGRVGMVVDKVTAESKAAELGLRTGDVIIRVNRKPFVSEQQLPSQTDGVQMTVMRGGSMMPLPRRHWTQPGPFPGPRPFPGNVPYPGFVPGRGYAPIPGSGPLPGPNSARRQTFSPVPMPSSIGPNGASAIAFASGNENVSVSQVGDQMVIEMQSPDIGPGQLRMKGTRQQILDELNQSDLSPAAKRKVRQALQ